MLSARSVHQIIRPAKTLDAMEVKIIARLAQMSPEMRLAEISQLQRDFQEFDGAHWTEDDVKAFLYMRWLERYEQV